MQSTSLDDLKNTIVRAGAGAGKTDKLTRQVLSVATQYYEREKKLPRIVVTTFTRKATQELRERLMLYAEAEGKPFLVDYASSKSHLFISTIHGVLNLFLSRYGHLGGLQPHYQFIASHKNDQRVRKILKKLIFEQKNSVELLEIYRFDEICQLCLQYFWWYCQNPEMSFATQKNFEREMSDYLMTLRERVSDLKNSIKNETDHASWLNHTEWLNQVQELLMRGPIGTLDLLKGLLKGYRSPVNSKKKPAVSEEIAERNKEILSLLREVVSQEQFWPEFWSQYEEMFRLFDHVAQKFCDEFSKFRTEQGEIQVADLESLSIEILKKAPESGVLFAQEWDYWLIDEYQDTSPIQVKLLQALIGEQASFIVGDPQQSIYLFRGARSEVFDEGTKSVIASGGEEKSLMVNYRSDPEVLLFLNDFFKGLGSQFAPMTPHVKEGDELNPQKVVAQIAICEKREEESTFEEQEVASIICQTQALLSSGTRPDQICVLGQTNQKLNDLSRAFQEHHIPFQLHISSGFYQRREILDAIALLKFFVNPHNNLNLYTLLRAPWCRISDQSLAKIAYERGFSYWKNIEVADFLETSEIEVIDKLKETLTIARDKGVSQALSISLKQFGLWESCQLIDESGRREANLVKFLTQVKKEERRSGFQTLEFLKNVQTVGLEGGGESDAVAAIEPNRVNLMTIHGSKGLQFEHVLIPFCGKAPQVTKTMNFVFDEEELNWSLPIIIGEEQKKVHSIVGHRVIEEMRVRERREFERVLYVAMTRAKRSLFLSFGKREKNSWVDLHEWGFETGLHEKKNYRYEVLQKEWIPQTIEAVLNTDIVQGHPYEYLTPKREQEVSVSHLMESQETDKKSPEVKSSLLKKVIQVSRGVELHRLLEAMKYMERSQVIQAIDIWFPENKEKIKEAIQYISSLQEPPLENLIKEGFVEWGFTFKEGKSIIEGQIDLWGRNASTNQVWLVDYKSGRSEYIEKAFEQLQIYSFALRKSPHVSEDESINIATVFPLEKKVEVRVAKEMEELKRLFRT